MKLNTTNLFKIPVYLPHPQGYSKWHGMDVLPAFLSSGVIDGSMSWGTTQIAESTSEHKPIAIHFKQREP